MLLRIWFVSFAILLMMVCLGCPLGDSKEYLKGAITVNKMNSSGEIEKMTFHFKDFPYNVSTDCRLSSKKIDDTLLGPGRIVFQYNSSDSEEMTISDYQSSVVSQIYEDQFPPTNRADYINKLVKFCTNFWDSYNPSEFIKLARENTTTAITFYPKIIDGKTCTVLEYTGLTDSKFTLEHYDKPTNVVALFMPLNETKEGCDRYLILASGNQTADWLDSVKVSKINKTC